MKRDYNAIEAIVIKKKGTIKYVNCNYKKLYKKTRYDEEYWYEYDERGNKIHYKDDTGFEEWMRYNENNDLIYQKCYVNLTIDSSWIERYYNDNGDEIYWKSCDITRTESYYIDSAGNEEWYDNNGNLIKKENKNETRL